MTLVERHCEPSRPDMAKITPAAAAEYLRELPGWSLAGGDRLERTFRFPDFAAALAFVNRVGAVAEREQHHPDLELSWGRVVVRISTHDAGGLTLNDFILAAHVGRTLPA